MNRLALVIWILSVMMTVGERARWWSGEEAWAVTRVWTMTDSAWARKQNKLPDQGRETGKKTETLLLLLLRTTKMMKVAVKRKAGLPAATPRPQAR